MGMDYRDLMKNYDRFQEVVAENNPATLLLAGHALLSQHLKELVINKLPSGDYFRASKISLQSLARLAAALELLPEGVMNAIIYIDNVRNDLAHLLHFRLEPKHADALYEILMSARLRLLGANTPLHDRIRRIINVLDSTVTYGVGQELVARQKKGECPPIVEL